MSTSAAERAYAHVKEQILEGTYTGGDLLTEGQVAGALGVSRTPVREAMLRLQEEGMLRLYPKKGAMVVPATAAETADVIEARALLESWAARRVATADHAEELADELERLVGLMRVHQGQGDVRAFSSVDRTFHETIVAAAGNGILTRVYRSLRERQICLTLSVIRVSEQRMTTAVDEHATLVALLRSGDAPAFADLLAAHVDNAARHLQERR